MRRIRSFLTANHPFFALIEATFVGVFFIQALRFLLGEVYARMGSASLFPTINPAQLDPTLLGLIQPSVASAKISFLVYMLALPALGIFIGGFRPVIVIATGITAFGRYWMLANMDLRPDVIGAAITLGGALLYIVAIARHRGRIFPPMMILAFGIDQLFRAYGNTLDPSWGANYLNIQLILSVVTIVISAIAFFSQPLDKPNAQEVSPDVTLITFWGGLSFGALLFLQVSLLALPNAIAGRATSDYTLLVAPTMVATLLPLMPTVRAYVRRFIGLFDSGVRGWVWMLIAMLFIVIGTRLTGLIAGISLILAQFTISLLWWWLIRPKAQKERSLGGLWLIFGVLLFVLLYVGDIFTYEYAFVRNFAPPLDGLNPIIPPLLRGFKGLGLGLLLLATFVACLPIVQTRRRIAWSGGNPVLSVVTLILVVGMSAGAVYFARPPIIEPKLNPQQLLVLTYNIHGGYNEFFYPELALMANTIEFSGADVVLLQEVEIGRMTSFGVDQALWLARRLRMDVRVYAPNEGIQGLAILSRVPIVFADGYPLENSVATKTGLQRVQIRPDANVITIYNLWLDPLLDTGGVVSVAELERGQQEQLSQIFRLVNTHIEQDGGTGRRIIGGTFNNIPSSDVIRSMTRNFVDYFADDTPETTVTFIRTGVRARLDYLWAWESDIFRVDEVTVIFADDQRVIIPRQASDHLPLRMVLRLN
ncbi:MAG: endonuclease/exonuclease/phosphatase family protein [bacterium]|nr:endonuclease/exonuclease/phosphatase family protein [bacterium]